MRHSLLNLFLLSILTFSLSPLTALAQTKCSEEELAKFVGLMAQSSDPEKNKEMDKQLRSTFEQMCAFMNDKSRADALNNLEKMLPKKSKEELRAERKARSAARKAKRKARKQAAAKPSPVLNAVLQAAPTAKSVVARFIDRHEKMHYLWIWDWDTLGDKTRILYTTLPDRVQFQQPDWKTHVYVVELTSGGAVTQHLIASKQANDHGALALRRGHDEIIFERHIDSQGEPSTLERWSISGERLVSSVSTPKPLWTDGKPRDWRPFRLATSDGNVLYSTSNSTRDKVSTVAWFEASPNGQVLGRGSISSSRDKITGAEWFRTSNGGGGQITHIQTTGDTGINSSIPTPIKRAVAGRELQAYVGFEKRLLVTSDNANSAWQSPAIERTLMWAGELALPKNLSGMEMIQQQNAQMDLMDSVTNEVDANRNTNYLNVGPRRIEMIKPMANGYGVLTTVTAKRNLQPPIHGQYFMKADKTGVHNKVYLEPLAKQLKVKFTTFAVSGNNDVYLYGAAAGRSSDNYVVLLDRNGKPKAYGRTSGKRIPVVEGMVGDKSGVWIFGHAYQGKTGARLWVERINFR